MYVHVCICMYNIEKYKIKIKVKKKEINDDVYFVCNISVDIDMLII